MTLHSITTSSSVGRPEEPPVSRRIGDERTEDRKGRPVVALIPSTISPMSRLSVLLAIGIDVRTLAVVLVASTGLSNDPNRLNIVLRGVAALLEFLAEA